MEDIAFRIFRSQAVCSIESQVLARSNATSKLLQDYSSVSPQPSPATPLTLHLPSFISIEALLELKSYLYSGKYPPPPLEGSPTYSPQQPNLSISPSQPLALLVSKPTVRQLSPNQLTQLYFLAYHFEFTDLQAYVAKDIRSTLDKYTAQVILQTAKLCKELLISEKPDLQNVMIQEIAKFGLGNVSVIGCGFSQASLDVLISLAQQWITLNGGEKSGAKDRVIKVRGSKKAKAEQQQ
ncbi:hypothetical protein HK098_000143 [Nowakowskiella sp. JEL0407]|nr:hypothetical protein HK098_000143 [Nowakowskiella sp. JEL0407]